jgi:hypothetical protein
MADLVATTSTALPPEEVMVRAVQFFTNENWRAQSQTNRIATFVGVPKIPWFRIALAILLMFCFIVPGVIYYMVVIAKLRRLQNIVVTTTPQELGCDVVATYPPYAQKLVDSFFAALPRRQPPGGVGLAPKALSQPQAVTPPSALSEPAVVAHRVARYCGECGVRIEPGSRFCESCGTRQ